jgi:hypothetical protein
MKDYSEGIYARLSDYVRPEPELEYTNVLILDVKDYTVKEDKEYPRKSWIPLCKAHLCFVVLPSGGLKCIKDRYDVYKRDTIWFGL